MHKILDSLNRYIYSGVLKRTAILEYIDFIHDLRDDLTGFLLEDEITAESINEYRRFLYPKDNSAQQKSIRSVYDDLVRLAVKRKQVIVCKRCGRAAEYWHNKKYCSLTQDGINCGKPSRNQRHYDKNADMIKAKSRKRMKEYRDLGLYVDKRRLKK